MPPLQPILKRVPLPVIPRLTRWSGPAPAQPMTPEEESSLLDSTLGWLQYAGETLDKPGAAVRGVLAGQPDQLLNLIPFSDAMGITDPRERVYGRELLEQYAGAPKNKPGLFNSPSDFGWDIGGFLAEVALDPLILVTGPGRALTKAGLKASKGVPLGGLDDAVKYWGKAIDKAPDRFRILGTTPKAMANEVRAAERGLLGLKIPFAKEPLKVFGAGSEKAARVIEAFNYGKFSPVRPIRYLWSKSVGGVWGSEAQMAADAAFTELRNIAGAAQNIVPHLGTRFKELESQFGDIAEHFKQGGTGDAAATFKDFQRFAGEQASAADRTAGLAADEVRNLFQQGPLKATGKINKFSEDFHAVLEKMNAIKDMGYKRITELGGSGEWLDDLYIKHFPRRPSNPKHAAAWDKTAQRRMLAAGFPFASARRDILKDIPDGAYLLNKMARDEVVTATRTRPSMAAVKHGSKTFRKGTAEEVTYKLGDTVRTLDEAGGAGRVYGLKGNRVNVQYTDANGVIRTRWVSHDQLAHWKLEKIPDHIRIPEMQPFVDDTALRSTLLEGIEEFGGDAGRVTAKTPLDKLQAKYLYHKYLKPAAERNAHRFDFNPAAMEEELMRLGTDAAAMTRETGDLSDGDILNYLAKGYVRDEAAGVLTRGPRASVATELTDYLTNLSQDVLQTGLFDRSLVDDFADYTTHIAMSLANMESSHGLMHSAATKIAEGATDVMPVVAAWRAVQSKQGKPIFSDRGIETFLRKHADELPDGDPTKGAIQEAAAKVEAIQETARRGGVSKELSQELTDAHDALLRAGDDIAVPAEAVHVLNAYMEMSDPATVGKLAGMFDAYTNAVKMGLTLPWPAFHMRNFTDGFWRNWASAKGRFSLVDLVRSTMDMMSGKAGKYADEMVDIRLYDNTLGRVVDQAAEGATGAFAVPFTEGGRIMGVPGTTPLRAAWRFAAKKGTWAYENVERVVRGAPYIALREKGFSPAQAKYLVDQTQYVYSLGGKGNRVNYAAQRAARRVIPFWGFVSNNIPYQLSQLFNAPGGRHAQTIRFMNTLREESGGYMPQWMRARGAVRLSGDDRNATFLRQFGLSIEELPLVVGSSLPKTIGRTAERMFSQAHPLATAPYKWAGRDPYTGRKMQNLNPIPGVPDWAAPLLMGSPAGRAVRTAQEIAYLFPGSKKHKPVGAVGMDLLTGLKTGTYDLEKQRLYELSDLHQQQRAEQPYAREHTTVYVPKSVYDEMTPEQQAQVDDEKATAQRLQAAIRHLRVPDVATLPQ